MLVVAENRMPAVSVSPAANPSVPSVPSARIRAMTLFAEAIRSWGVGSGTKTSVSPPSGSVSSSGSVSAPPGPSVSASVSGGSEIVSTISGSCRPIRDSSAGRASTKTTQAISPKATAETTRRTARRARRFAALRFVTVSLRKSSGFFPPLSIRSL